MLSVYVGTDDIGATDGDPTGGGATGNNMRPVQINEYDGNSAGGDGNLTQQNLPADSTTNRIWTFAYDWRDRQTQVNAPQDYYVVNTFNTLDLVTEVQQFASASPNYLINQTQTFYDNLARVYQTIRFAVDPTSGTVGNSLTDKTWYDPAGNVIKQRPGGSQVFIKNVFDNLNRQVTQYMGYDYSGSESNYASASDVTDDTIVEQVETAYDQARNVIQTTTRQRFHNATGTGALTTPSGSQPKARVTYVAVYPDAIGRTQAVADYGTNGDVTLSRSATIPARADTVLVSSTLYNSRGEAYQSTDPAGLVSQLTFDDAGRKTQLVVNPTGSSSSSSSSSSSTNLPVSDDQNNTTLWSYTADDLIATVTAVNAATGNQVTTYNYGTLLANSDNIARNDLVISVVYPDSSSDKVTYLYNRQSQVKQLTDQRGVVHAYDFDSLGRLIHDRVTSLGGSGSSSSSSGGPSVDAAVRRIERTYEVRGMLASVTNFDNPTVGSGNIVTQIEFAYNTFSQLATETDFYAIVGSSVSTQYTYADGSGGTIRRLTMTYPSGRVLSYKYGTSQNINDALSRPQYLLDNDGATHLGDYSYLGLSTIVQVAYAEPGVTWSLINGTGVDPYSGFDQFNRVVDNRWFSTGGSSSSSSSSSSPGGVDLDRIQHAYDRASNRLWRRNTVGDAASGNVDELYAYDALQRLTDYQRGQLNSGNNGIVSGTLGYSQAWGLDATGNWSTFQQYDPNTGDTTDNQTHNKVNEITFSANRGPIAYDAAGNTTILAVTFTNQVDVTYDAWNRAASVAGQPYLYDGLGRLAIYGSNYNYYYSDSWQLIEQRQGTSTTYERQWVWGLRYIDDLVLRDSGDFTPNRLYAMQDPNWSVTGIVDTTGTVQERYAYDGYGMPFFMNGYFVLINFGVSSNFGWETLFAGYRYNSAYMYLVRNRWYSPFIGRWLTRDPAARVGSNLYDYTLSQPIKYGDPSGLAVVIPVAAGVGLLIGIGGAQVVQAEQPPCTSCTGKPSTDPRFYKTTGRRKKCAISIALVCRKMPDERKILGTQLFTHCFLAVKKDGAYIAAVSGMRDDAAGSPTEGRTVYAKSAGVPDWDLLEIKDSPYREYPLDIEERDPCCYIQCADEYARQISGLYGYSQYIDNSNTFITRVIRNCGGTAFFPLSAVASDDIVPKGLKAPILSACFLPGTQIMCANGLIAIEALHPGDEVVAIDLQSGNRVLAPVTRLHRAESRRYFLLTVDEDELAVTPTHPVYALGKGWTHVFALIEGDLLRRQDGSAGTVSRISLKDNATTVYNLSVGSPHNYCVGAGGYLVHNKGP